MMKFKTLKDIPWEFGNFTTEEAMKFDEVEKPLSYTLKTISDYKDELRKAAIEWIKLFDEFNRNPDPHLIPIEYQGIMSSVSMNWIKTFFHITEEGLK